VASWLVCLPPEQAVRVQALAGDTVVFLGKTLNSHSASLHPGVLMGTCKLLAKPNKLQGNDLQWTSIPSRGSRNNPSHFMPRKAGISSLQSPTGFIFFILGNTGNLYFTFFCRLERHVLFTTFII